MPELDFTLAENLVTGSLMFTDSGNVFIDRDGVLWKTLTVEPEQGRGLVE